MKTEDLIQVIAQILTTAGLLFVLYQYFKSVEIKKEDHYIQFELSSLEIFRLTIEFPELLELYNPEPKKKLKRKANDRLIEFASSLLNLFEIQFRLRKKESIEPIIFASWIPWIISLVKGKHFRTIWKNDLNIHYEPEFRKFINNIIEIVEKDPSEKNEENLYAMISQEFKNCKIIKNWKETI